MDSFEFNKIAGAILFTLLVAFGLHLLSDVIFESPVPKVPGYVITVRGALPGDLVETLSALG